MLRHGRTTRTTKSTYLSSDIDFERNALLFLSEQDVARIQAFNDPDGVFDANSVLLTTLVNSNPSFPFSSGQVGLYDFYSGLSFSNFSVVGTLVESVSVPGPVAGAGFPGLFFAGISLLAWRRVLRHPAQVPLSAR
jgi:hypothetical protein